MKCLVCSKEFTGSECPRCKFPVVSFPGDLEAGLKAMEPTIRAYRAGLLGKTEFSVTTYTWQDEDGTLIPQAEEISLGTGEGLRGKTTWLDQKFARDPDSETLTVQAAVTIGGEREQKRISIPNLMEAQLQQLGIEMDEDYRFCLLLRNDTQPPTRSEWTAPLG